MASRRLQNWTNRNLFLGSFDSRGSVDSGVPFPPVSYQHTGPGAGVAFQPPRSLRRQSPLAAGGNCESVAEEAEGGWRPEGGEADGVGGGGEGHAPGGKSITTLQAAWNVTNAIQGMFIVGLPFAIKVGGWCALLALTFVAWVCYRTGLALVECLYEEQTDEGGKKVVKKVRRSYREVAEAVRPGLGKFVLAAQLTELASTCILYIVLAGDLLQGCFPSVDRPAWMMLTTVILLGTAFLDDLRIVSHLSLANAVSHLIINAIMVFYCLSQFSDWHLSSVAIVPNFRLFPTIIGVVVFGYTSHIFLPALEGSMQDPSEFQPMLALSHSAAAVFKALFGLIGFLTFAEFTQKEISNSLPNQAFKVLINLVLVTKALLSYPLPYYAIVQLFSDNFFRGVHLGAPFPSCYGHDKKLREWALSLRILLILWTLWMALSVPYLVELMGLIGNITGTVLSFIWPAYFHLRLRGHKCSPAQRRFNKLVIGGGVSTCVLGIFYSWMELLHAIRNNNEAES